MNERDRNMLERGATALRVGDLAAAERLCREVLQRTPENSEALNVLGAVAFSRRNFREAERLFNVAVSAQPDNLAALFNLGKVYEVTKRLDDAADVYLRILRRAPDNDETEVRLGIVRYEQAHLEEAATVFEAVLRRSPGNIVAALSLGVTYNALTRYEDSVRILRRLLEEHPDSGDAYHALADSLYELHRADEAAEVCNAALARDQADTQAMVLLGQAEAERGAYVKAERLFKQASAFAPERHEPYMNLGVLLQRLGRIGEALEYGERAVNLAPEDPLAHFNLGMGLLLAGEFARGWPELEWRLLDQRLRDHFPYHGRLRLWDGELFGGRRLLISREQGLGDFILFSRFFPRLKSRDVRTIVEVPPELASLYERFPGIDELVVGRCPPERLDAIVAHVPLCSLPFILAVNEPAIPRTVPYLSARPELRERFAERFARCGTRLKVGIVWAGSPGHLLDRYRSCRLAEFEALADLNGIAWFSLQKGAASAQTAAAGFALNDLSGELASFEETAAAIAELDLIVSVDTAVAHLAGALGKPVWLINGFGNYWLWQLERSDSPWYPTMRLFRQHRPNVWDDLFSDVRDALLDELERHVH